MKGTASFLRKNLNKNSIFCFEILLIVIISCISLGIRHFGVYSLLALSLFCISVLWYYLYYCFTYFVNSSFRKNVVAFSLLASVTGFLLYLVIIKCRNYEYMADYACYYNLQEEYYQLFSLHVLKGFWGTLQSFWFSDYSYFICMFTSLPFYFSTRSNDAFVLTYYVFLIIPVIIVINIYLSTVCNRLKRQSKVQNNAVFLLGNATILFFPLLHADSILGMPDLFGLSFLLVVSLVLFEYDIRTINWNNNWILIFSTLAAIISRRWYVFGIIGAYTGFAIASILYNIKDAKKVIINGVYTSVFLGIVIFIVLCPFFIHSLNSHYSIAYSAWKYGGALWEIRHQGMFLGVLISGLIVLGGIIGLSRKETRFSSTVAIIGFFITIITFTRIQNFMSHHTLCLMPTYLSLLFNVILHISSIKRTAFRRIIGSIFLLIFLVNFSCSISGKVIRDGRIHWINSITLYVNNADTHANAWE